VHLLWTNDLQDAYFVSKKFSDEIIRESPKFRQLWNRKMLLFMYTHWNKPNPKTLLPSIIEFGLP